METRRKPRSKEKQIIDENRRKPKQFHRIQRENGENLIEVEENEVFLQEN